MHFNSQPHEEADFQYPVLPLIQDYFNSQPHEEADEVVTASSFYLYDISTHSLTKRLTITRNPTDNMLVISTHSLTKRLTTTWKRTDNHEEFQLTASRRG